MLMIERLQAGWSAPALAHAVRGHGLRHRTVMAFIAALHAGESGEDGGGIIAARLEMLITRPHFACRI
jgi:hypothetical protein